METLITGEEVNQVAQARRSFPIIPTLQVPSHLEATRKTVNPSTRELVAETENLNNQNTYDQLNQFFVERDSKQRGLLEARNLLGEKEKELNDEQVSNLASEVQYLVDTWLEEFERNIYGGKTLNELFNLKNL